MKEKNLENKILVTGGMGYIGSHVVNKLISAGYKPIIVDDLSNSFEQFFAGTEFINVDLKNFVALETVFLTHKFLAVIHLAAAISVTESTINPLKYYQNNLLASINLFTLMKKYQVKNLIFSSTAAVYGDVETNSINEQQTLKPINPYGNSKSMVEMICQDLAKANQLNCFVLRYFNVAGADLEHNLFKNSKAPLTHLIPSLNQAIYQNLPFYIFGTNYPTPDKTAIRDYVHIIDLAEAHLLALNYLLTNQFQNKFEVVNVGSGTGFSVEEIVQVANKLHNNKINVQYYDKRLGDPAILRADISKIIRILNWKPKYTIIDMIKSDYDAKYIQ